MFHCLCCDWTARNDVIMSGPAETPDDDEAALHVGWGAHHLVHSAARDVRGAAPHPFLTAPPPRVAAPHQTGTQTCRLKTLKGIVSRGE
jgi:hypothetical protein